MKDNPTPPESGGSLEQLVELMAENNRATSEIERDGRNTRRHLLEMKKIQQASLDMSDRVNTGFDNFFETMNANKLGDEEKASERSSIFEEIRDELREMRSSGIPQESGSSSGGGNRNSQSYQPSSHSLDPRRQQQQQPHQPHQHQQQEFTSSRDPRQQSELSWEELKRQRRQ